MKIRILNLLLSFVLVLSLFTGALPGGIFAPHKAQAAYDTAEHINVNAPVTGAITINSGGEYRVYGENEANTFINVTTSDPVTLYLDGVSIKNPTRSPLHLSANANVTLVVMNGTDNTFWCSNGTNTGSLPTAGIYVPAGATLTIGGSDVPNSGGILSAMGGGGGQGGSSTFGSAGIGGSSFAVANAGTITIDHPDVTVNATANVSGLSGTPDVGYGGGAGIGGGAQGNGGTFNMISGTVVAMACSGAGIGGGSFRENNNKGEPELGNGGIINISGGTITATSRYAAAIGGGHNVFTGGNSSGGSGGRITISGGTVYATIKTSNDNTAAAAIGYGGNWNNNANYDPAGVIVITGGSVYPIQNNGGVEQISICEGNGPGKPNSNKTYTVTNGASNGSIKVYPVEVAITVPGGFDASGVIITVEVGGAFPYTYTAVTNADGKACIWLPDTDTGAPPYTNPPHIVKADKPGDDLWGQGSVNLAVGASISPEVNSAASLSFAVGIARLTLSKSPDATKVYSGGVTLSAEMINTLAAPIIGGVDLKISEVKWFRENLNGATNIADIQDSVVYFNANYGTTGLGNYGTPGGDLSDPETDTIDGGITHSYTMTVDKNARYWFYAKFTDGYGNSCERVSYKDVNNIFAPYVIYERGFAEHSDDWPSSPPASYYLYYPVENGYFPLPGEHYGVPFDMNETVLSEVLAFGGYDSFIINSRPEYRDNWEAYLEGSPRYNLPSYLFPSAQPYTVVMNEEFLSGAYQDTPPTGAADNACYYTVVYEKTQWWQDVVVKFMDTDGNTLTPTSPVPDTLYFPYDMNASPTPEFYVDFLLRGGRYIPPTPIENTAGDDYMPVGYFVGTYTSLDYGEIKWVPDFGQFDPVGIRTDAAPPTITIIYSNTIKLITQRYRHISPDDYSRVLSRDATAILVGDYIGGPQPVVRFVPVGYVITGLVDGDREYDDEFWFIYPGPAGYKLTYPWDSQLGHPSFIVNIPFEHIGENTVVTWLYDDDLSVVDMSGVTGIPRSDGIIITTNWIGHTLDIGDANDAPVIIKTETTYSRKYSVTDPDMITITNDGETGNWNHFFSTGVGDGKWLYAKGVSGAPAVDINMDDDTLVIEFHYYLDSQGNGIPDKDEKVIEKYYYIDYVDYGDGPERVIEEFLTAVYPSREFPFLYGVSGSPAGTYNKRAPSISGYVAVGWFIGDCDIMSGSYPDDAAINHIPNSSTPVNASFVPDDGGNTISFFYREEGSPVTVYWRGHLLGGNAIDLGQLSLTGWVGETTRVTRSDKNITAPWKPEPGPDYTSYNDDYFGSDFPDDYYEVVLRGAETLGGGTKYEYEFGYTQDLDSVLIYVMGVSDSGAVFYNDPPQTVNIKDPPGGNTYTKQANYYLGYSVYSYNITDIYGNRMQKTNPDTGEPIFEDDGTTPVYYGCYDGSGSPGEVMIEPRYGDQILTFLYSSSMTTVTIVGLDAGADDPHENPLFTTTRDAETGAPFYAIALGYLDVGGVLYVLSPDDDPSFDGVSLVDYAYRQIAAVQPGQRIEFYYRQLPADAVLIRLLDSETGDIIGARIAWTSSLSGYVIPDMSVVYYTFDHTDDGELDWSIDGKQIVNFVIKSDEIFYDLYYTKDRINIVIVTVDKLGKETLDQDGQPAEQITTGTPVPLMYEERMGEIFTFVPPILNEYTLKSDSRMAFYADKLHHSWPSGNNSMVPNGTGDDFVGPDMDLVDTDQYHTFYDAATNTIYVYCIYAFDPNTATVVFDLGGGEFPNDGRQPNPSDPPPTVRRNDPGKGFDVPEPTRDGYEFIGWSPSLTLTDINEYSSHAPNLNPDYKYYHGTFGSAGTVRVYKALWSPKAYTVTFSEGYHGEFSPPAVATKLYVTYDKAVNTGGTTVGAGDFVMIPGITPDTNYYMTGWGLLLGSTGIPGNESELILDGVYDDAAVASYIVLSDVTFIALYAFADDATVIFNYQGGLDDEGKSFKMTFGTPSDPIVSDTFSVPIPERPHYDLKGWLLPDDDTIYTKADIEDLTEGHTFGAAMTVTVYNAVWELTNYTVTFDAGDGGTLIGATTRSKTYGETVGTPPTVDAFAATYYHIGWSKLQNGAPVGFFDDIALAEYTVSGDVTFVAVYTEMDKATVIFVYNGGTESGSTATEKIIRGLPGSLYEDAGGVPVLSRKGYVLSWRMTEDGGAPSDATPEGTTPFSDTVQITTYSAVWTPEQYTITFNAGVVSGAITGGVYVHPTSVNYGAQISSIGSNIIPSLTIPTTHTFSGWSDDFGIFSSDGVLNYTVTGDVTFTAQWVPINHAMVVFNYDGGTYDSKSSLLISGLPNSSFADDVPTPTRYGYAFNGWAPSMDDKTFGDSGTTTVYDAQWLPGLFSVIFSGGDHGSIQDTDQFRPLANGDLVGAPPTVTLTDSSYYMTGWKSSLVPGLFSDTDVAALIVTDDVTFTAQYAQLDSARVIFDYYGGIGTTGVTLTGEQGTAFDVDNPTREGYEFTGWVGAATLSPKGADAYTGFFGAPSSVNIYTAQWGKLSYDVAFDSGAGTMSGSSSLSVEHGNLVATTPTITPPTGNIFTGWKADPGDGLFDSKAVENYPVTFEVTFTAQYASVVTTPPTTVTVTATSTATSTGPQITIPSGPTVVPATMTTVAATTTVTATSTVTSAATTTVTTSTGLPVATTTATTTQTATTTVTEPASTLQATVTVTESSSPTTVIATTTVTTSTSGTKVGQSNENESWAILNLVFCAIGALLAIYAVCRAFISGGKGEGLVVRPLFILLAVILAVAGAVVFFLTEDLSLPIGIVDNWTVVNTAILALGLLCVLLSFGRERDNYRAAG